jgi:hypothetical protein
VSQRSPLREVFLQTPKSASFGNICVFLPSPSLFGSAAACSCASRISGEGGLDERALAFSSSVGRAMVVSDPELGLTVSKGGVVMAISG